MDERDKREDGKSGVPKRSHSDRKLWWVFVVLCVMILVLSALVLMIKLRSNGDDFKKNDTQSIGDNEGGLEDNEVFDDSKKENDYYDELKKVSVQDYVSEMNSKIEAATSDDQRRDLYVEKAINLQYFDFDRDEMLNIVLKDLYMAEEISPNMNTAFWIYYYEDQAGNNSAAEEYLKKAQERGYDESKGEG